MKYLSITGERGTQCIKIDDNTLPLMFDGFKVFCVLDKPTTKDLHGDYPIYELTSSQAYKPQKRRYSCRINVPPTSLANWQANLGYPTEERTEATLKNTTQYITSLEAEICEYM